MNTPSLGQRAAATARYRRSSAIVLAVLAAAGLAYLAPAQAAVAAAAAAGVLLAIAAMAISCGLMLSRLVRKTLTARPHLARLGRQFERDYADVRVLSVEEDPHGQLRVQLAWEHEHTVELDADGHPDSSLSAGAGSLSWTLPAQPLSPEERALLLELPDTDVHLMEQGTVMLNGPVTTSRALTAANGVVIQANAPLPPL